MIRALRRFFGRIGLPAGADADPVIERLQHHDEIVAELEATAAMAKETRRRIERGDGLVTAMVRGTRGRRRPPDGGS